MTIKKPKLSLDEQIEHLKDKGILFNIMDGSDAKKYLEQNNNYFKLTAYRKNYNKHPDGKNKGKYINLVSGRYGNYRHEASISNRSYGT